MPVVLVFSQLLHLINVLTYGEHHGCSTCAEIADILQNMVDNENASGVKLIPVKITTTYEEV